MFTRLTLPTLLLAAALAFLGAPDSRISAAECGGPGDNLCKEHEECAWILFWRACTTTYDYWQTEGEEPDDEEPDAGEPGDGDGPH